MSIREGFIVPFLVDHFVMLTFQAARASSTKNDIFLE